jgi:hypothetical protein
MGARNAARGSSDWRANVGEGRRRAAADKRRREEHDAEQARHREALALSDFERTGAVAASLREAALESEREAAGFVQALGGPERVSEQRLAIVRDLARAGVVVRALFAQMLKSGALELDAVAKLTTLIGARRAGLLALGLDRVEADALDLATYIAQRAAGGTEPKPREPAPETDAPDAGGTARGREPDGEDGPRDAAEELLS